MPVLLWLLDGTGGWRAGFALGWCAGAGYFTATLFWLVEPFLVDAARHGWMAPFALAGMAGGLALFWGAAFGVARAVWPGGWRRVPVLAAAWTLAEFLRAHVLSGFPWGLVAYGWLDTPVMQSAALWGPHFLGFLTLTVGLLPGLATWRAVAGAAMLVAAGWGVGAARLAAPVPERAGAPMVRIVQPNAAQHLKWRPEMQAVFFDRLLAESRAPAPLPPDVVIWPETAVPFLLGADPGLQRIVAEAAGAPLILGIRRAEQGEASTRWFNSLAVLGPDGAVMAVYDKHHLVPFGEYVPLGAQIADLGLPVPETLTLSGFSAGPGPRRIDVPGIPAFVPLICYEAIFPHGLDAPGGRAEWLVQITNDAWFGQAAGPWQHLAQARVRAIEQGLPLARAANTGISAMIDARGRIVAQIGLDRHGHLDARLPPALGHTFYARVGDLPFIALVVLVFGLTLTNFSDGVSGRRRR